MKKIIVLIIVSLSVVLVLQSQEQTVYKPFWGKDSTMQYCYTPTFWTVEPYPYHCKVLGASGNNKEGVLFRSYISTNEDNSKLWDITDKPWHDSILIADMDLAIGDSLEIVRGTKNVVNKVFWEAGLKHIQFDLNFLIQMDSLNEEFGDNLHTVFYEIVEGVGPIYPDIPKEWFAWLYPDFSGLRDKYYRGFMIRGIWRDGSPFYIHPLWRDLWNYGSIHGSVSIDEIQNHKVEVTCGENDLLQIRVGDSSSEMKVGIYDLAGKLLWTDSFWGDYEYSLASFQRGTYIVKVNEYSTKILLP